MRISRLLWYVPIDLIFQDPEPHLISELKEACVKIIPDETICNIIMDIERSRSTQTDHSSISQSGFSTERRRDLYFAKGNIYLSQKQFQVAKVEYFKGFVAIGVNIASIFSSRGEPTITPQQVFGIFQNLQGLADHSRSPAVAAVIQSIAKLYQDSGMNSLAIASYYLSISLWPTANTCNNLGILLSHLRLNEAIKWYELGLAIDPSHFHIVCL
jgi:tetratricopeptide (TPR) repeat protein